MLKWIDWLSVIVGRAASWLLIITVITIFIEVVARYFFNSPTEWGAETALYSSVITIVLAGTYCQQKRSHIAITSVHGILSEKTRHYLDGFNLIFTFLVCFTLFLGSAKWGWNAFINMQTTGSAWNPPAPAIIKPLFPIAFLMVSIQCFAQFIRLVRGEPDPIIAGEPDGIGDQAPIEAQDSSEGNK